MGSNDLFRFQHNDRSSDSDRDHLYRLGESQHNLSDIMSILTHLPEILPCLRGL
jgi:hypothetical protein